MISALVLSICCVQKRRNISDTISMLVFNFTQVRKAMKEDRPPLVFEYNGRNHYTRPTDVKMMSPSTLDTSRFKD